MNFGGRGASAMARGIDRVEITPPLKAEKLVDAYA